MRIFIYTLIMVAALLLAYQSEAKEMYSVTIKRGIKNDKVVIKRALDLGDLNVQLDVTACGASLTFLVDFNETTPDDFVEYADKIIKQVCAE